MKKLYLLSILFIVSCATAPIQTHSERTLTCVLENYNEYYGECYIAKTESDPAFTKMINNVNMMGSWNLVKRKSSDIARQVNAGTLTPKQGNIRFERLMEGMTNREDVILREQYAQRQARQQQIGLALKAVSDATRQPVQTNTNVYTPLKTTYVLESSSMSGTNTICIYSLGMTKATHTIIGAGACPATMEF